MDRPGPEVITPTLIKAARALLKIDQETLAKAAGISRKTLSLIEIANAGRTDPRRHDMLAALRRSLEEDYGVVFTFASPETGEGVRLRSARTELDD